MPGHFKVNLVDLVTKTFYVQPVPVSGELFCLFCFTTSEAFSLTVFHFGPKEETEVFKYGVKMGNSEEYISITCKFHSYMDGCLTDLQPKMFVVIYYDPILDLVSESGYLSCEIEIGREKLDGFVSDELQEFLPVFVVVGSEIPD
jgi:hypothetical protein